MWYTRLFGDRIGRIDPETLEVTEYASPVKGPRRMRFDQAGVLWVTGYSEGTLARIETDGYQDQGLPHAGVRSQSSSGSLRLRHPSRNTGYLDQREHDRPNLSVHS